MCESETSPNQLDHLGMESPLSGAESSSAVWLSPECEWREATSDASDSRGGVGGRVATCDGSVEHLIV